MKLSEWYAQGYALMGFTPFPPPYYYMFNDERIKSTTAPTERNEGMQMAKIEDVRKGQV